MSLWKTDRILLGHQGDMGTTISVDISEALIRWPGCTAEILVLRPGESDAYLANTEADGSAIVWTIDTGDTATAGQGSAELVIYSGGKRAYSCIAKTEIRPSIHVPDDPDIPGQAWIDTVVRAKNDTLEAKEEVEAIRDDLGEKYSEIEGMAGAIAQDLGTAVEAADDAEMSAAEALASAELAERYANMAEACAESHGIFWLEYDEHGTLWYYYTENLDGLYFELDTSDPTGTLYACVDY